MYSMADHKRKKINLLQRLLPEGAIVEARWLEAKGYPRNLRKHYLESGWLESPGRGLVSRPGPPLAWQNVVFSLQTVMNYDVLVGGRTSLDLQGYEHYLRPDEAAVVHLYSDGTLPNWLDKLELRTRFVPHKTTRLFAEGALSTELSGLCEESDEPRASSLSVTSHVWGPPHQPILLSSLERAILELLDELPEHESFHHVDVTFESLTNLRPARLQKLLEACHSVKVKRLFFWFAHRHRHAWLNRLDEKLVNLGSGKRALVPGGKLDRRYLITVPEAMHGDQ